MDKKIFLLISLLLIFGASFVWAQAQFGNNPPPFFSRLLSSFFEQPAPVFDQPKPFSGNRRLPLTLDRFSLADRLPLKGFCRKDSDCSPLPDEVNQQTGTPGACVHDGGRICPLRGKCVYPGLCTRGPNSYCDISTGRIVRAPGGQYCPVADSQGPELWTWDIRNCQNLHNQYKKCRIGDSQCPKCGLGTTLDPETNECLPEKKCVVGGCNGGILH